MFTAVNLATAHVQLALPWHCQHGHGHGTEPQADVFCQHCYYPLPRCAEDGRRHSPDLHSRKQTRLHRVHLHGICSQKNWTVEAAIQDLGSGLSNVYARPDGIASVVVGLAPGTKDLVNVTYSADCCSSQVDIIGVDTQGNVGKCVIDMGALGGYILDLEADEVGETWVLLRWEITSSDLNLHKYRLLINNDFTQEFCAGR
ncbi:uncharacterized protein LOC119585369 [Penaeus monodon]|uniref:uncharacterized protein LOC119585369 n=1 Tax=Penaeus monodon TaxID=6687 RepID=UPI0018A74C30|nr:uncharacterized protein LOC119585369 [Penaeus monodon]